MEWIKRHWSLSLLVFLTVALRLIPIWPDKFSFQYDNAKDSLVIMEMGIRHKPALFGAVTSIDGVYNGPAWYYLSLPLNVALNYRPLAGVLTVILLAGIGVFLASRLGFLEGLLYATSLGLIGAQQSAWTPYMTAFLSLPILMILLQLTPQQKPKPWQLPLLFFLVSLNFHFQTAFGVVILPLVILILLGLKIRISWRSILYSSLAFLIPFTPWLVFELRHNFHQTQEIIKFIFDYQHRAQVVGQNQSGVMRVGEIAGYAFSSLVRSLPPLKWVLIFGLSLSGLVGLLKKTRLWSRLVKHQLWTTLKNLPVTQKQTKIFSNQEKIIYIILLLGTCGGYLFLPAKSYYFVALIPVWLVGLAKVVRSFFKEYLPLVYLTLFLAAGVGLYQNIQVTERNLQTAAFPYQPKSEAVDLIYKLSQGQPFVSYHFTPEIYDYTYQQIFLQKIHDGYPVPVEFSYLPGEVAYIQQKHLPTNVGGNEQVFLIIEKPVYERFLNDWWARLQAELQLEIVERINVNESIQVVQARRQ